MSKQAIAEAMRAYATAAIACVQQGVELDYSMQSLRVVEQLIELDRKGNEHDDDRLRGLANLWGAYVGEVFRRRWGGEWSFPEEGPFEKRICLVIRDTTTPSIVREITLLPLERACKQLVNRSEDGIWFYACALEHRLSRRPE